MPVSFRSLVIPGVYGELKLGSWAVQVARQHFANVEGESEIRGKRGGRDITLEGIWYNGYATALLLETAIETSNRQAPINGTLSRTGPIVDSYGNCTFMGIHITRGPLPSDVLGWFATVEIHFRQLKPD